MDCCTVNGMAVRFDTMEIRYETNKTFSDYDSDAIVQRNGECP